jgi:hypothetical protein
MIVAKPVTAVPTTVVRALGATAATIVLFPVPVTTFSVVVRLWVP